MRRVMQRLRHAEAHPRRRADAAVEPRVAHHLDDGRHAAPLFADERGPGAVELDLARRVRAVAELVLQRWMCIVFCTPSGAPARHQEARQPALGLRQRQERVAHRRRAEPLVPDELAVVALAWSRAWCWRARRCRPASRSSPCRTGRPASRRRGDCADRSARKSAAAPTRSPARASSAAPAPPSRSSRSDSRTRLPPASAS